MAAYNIYFKASVDKDLRGISKKDVKRVFGKIKSLAKDPRPIGCEKLSGTERYRIRQGRYRIIYSVQDDELTVWVITVGHRKEVYR